MKPSPEAGLHTGGTLLIYHGGYRAGKVWHFVSKLNYEGIM